MPGLLPTSRGTLGTLFAPIAGRKGVLPAQVGVAGSGRRGPMAPISEAPISEESGLLASFFPTISRPSAGMGTREIVPHSV